MTNQEMMFDAIKYGEMRLAYSMYWLISKDGVDAKQEFNGVDFHLVDHEEVNKLIEINPLQIKIVNVYSIQLSNYEHEIILAYTEEEAAKYFFWKYKRFPERIFDISNKIQMEFWIPDRKKFMSIWEMKEEALVIPCTAMVFQKSEHKLTKRGN